MKETNIKIKISTCTSTGGHITSGLFEDYLNCPTKCFLRASGEKLHGNAYADWLTTHNETYRQEAIKTLVPEVDNASWVAPMRFTFANNLSRIDRLLLAFDAWALAKNTGANVETGKMIHGDDYKASRIKLAPLMADVRKRSIKLPRLYPIPIRPGLRLIVIALNANSKSGAGDWQLRKMTSAF